MSVGSPGDTFAAGTPPRNEIHVQIAFASHWTNLANQLSWKCIPAIPGQPPLAPLARLAPLLPLRHKHSAAFPTTSLAPKEKQTEVFNDESLWAEWECPGQEEEDGQSWRRITIKFNSTRYRKHFHCQPFLAPTISCAPNPKNRQSVLRRGLSPCPVIHYPLSCWLSRFNFIVYFPPPPSALILMRMSHVLAVVLRPSWISVFIGAHDY